MKPTDMVVVAFKPCGHVVSACFLGSTQCSGNRPTVTMPADEYRRKFASGEYRTCQSEKQPCDGKEKG